MRSMISARPPAKRPPHSALAAGPALSGGSAFRGGAFIGGWGHRGASGSRIGVKMRFRRAVVLAVVPCLLAAGWVAANLSHLSAGGGKKPPPLSEVNPTR